MIKAIVAYGMSGRGSRKALEGEFKKLQSMGIEVVASVLADAEKIKKLIEERKPDVVVMNIIWEGPDFEKVHYLAKYGLELIAAIHQMSPNTLVCVPHPAVHLAKAVDSYIWAMGGHLDYPPTNREAFEQLLRESQEQRTRYLERRRSKQAGEK